MNKKLLTVAIGAALASPMLAQADVTVSGQLHMSYDEITTLQSVTYPSFTNPISKKEWNVSSNASNFKIVISEDVGHGMKAIGLIQEYVRMDNLAGGNSSGLFNGNQSTASWPQNDYSYASTKNTNRLQDGEAYAGLSTGFGTVRFGSMDSPAKLVGRIGDFFNNQIGDTRNLDINNNRLQNTIAYTSPTFFGVTVALNHSTNVDNSLIGANPWSNGSPFWWSAGYGTAKDTAASVAYKGNVGPVGINVGAAVETMTLTGKYSPGMPDEKWSNLNAAFDVGPATIKAFYQMHRNVNFGYTPASGYTGTWVVPTSSTVQSDKEVMGAGVAFKFLGSETIKGQFAKVEDQKNATLSAGAKMVALGYDHAFSKNSTGYLAYARTLNANNKRYSMAAGGHGDQPTVAQGETMEGVSIGAIINF